MTSQLRIALCLLLTALGSSVASLVTLRAEDEAGAKEPRKVVDTSMAHRINGAWTEIRGLQKSGRTEEAEKIQRELAGEFFEDYLKSPETTPGQQALTTAFRMWGNVGATGEIEQAMARIDQGSSLWGHLVLSARPAFVARDRLDDFRRIVADLAVELTNLEARSEVWILLGRDYRSTGDLDEAGACFRRTIELGADPIFVDAAKTALREIDVLAPGRPAPEFDAPDLDGAAIRLSSLRGSIVLLEFWSTTCAPCLPVIDHLQKIRSASSRDEVALIGVALDRSTDDVRRVVETKTIDWPQICDEKGADGPVPRLYGVRGVPRSFLIDRQGRIVAKDLRGKALERALAELLEGDDERDDG